MGVIPMPSAMSERALSTSEKAFSDTRAAFVLCPSHLKMGDHASRAAVRRRNTTGLPPRCFWHIQCARAESK